jgi:hypothetical protein
MALEQLIILKRLFPLRTTKAREQRYQEED